MRMSHIMITVIIFSLSLSRVFQFFSKYRQKTSTFTLISKKIFIVFLKGPRINGLVGARAERSFAVIDSPLRPHTTLLHPLHPPSPRHNCAPSAVDEMHLQTRSLSFTSVLTSLLFQPIIDIRQLIDRSRSTLF